MMLPFIFTVAVVMYCISYWLWAVAQTHPQSWADIIVVVNAMLFVPGNTIFFIFRGLLLATAFYLVAEFLYAGVRRGLKGREKEEPRELKMKFIHSRKM